MVSVQFNDLLFIYFIFISLTPKGKVSTEGKAYRRVTYKNKTKQTYTKKQNRQTNTTFRQ